MPDITIREATKRLVDAGLLRKRLVCAECGSEATEIGHTYNCPYSDEWAYEDDLPSYMVTRYQLHPRFDLLCEERDDE